MPFRDSDGVRVTKSKGSSITKAIGYFWLLLLFIWPIFAGLSGMVVDAGYNWHVFIFLISIWTYPAVLALAYVLRKTSRVFILLPLINLLAYVVSGSMT
jgi:hypothetical protein